MRDPDRIPRILAKLATYWRIYPDLRLGQLVSNLARQSTTTPFYTEDSPIEAELDREIRKATDRASRGDKP